MPWAFIIPAAASLIGGAISSDGARSAANKQQDATNSAMGEQRRQFDLAYGDQRPYREAGGRALGALEADINTGLTPESVLQEPGYQFGLKQGLLGVDRKAAAAGGRISGAALKAAAEYGTNYAATGYNAAWQRKQDRQNRSAALAGIGQTATGASAAAGANSANAISSLLSSQGDAAGAARLAQGNIWGNVLNQTGAQAGRYFKNNPIMNLPYNIDPNDNNAGQFFNGPG